jgi:hypothetical protein
MTLQMMLGFDDTIVETQLSATGGSSGITGRNGTGLAHRKTAVSTAHMAILPTALSTLYVGVAIRFNTLGSQRTIGILAPDGATIHCGFGVNALGQLTIYGPAGTVIATSATSPVLVNVWNYFEVKVVIHDTTGSVEVRMNEAVMVSFSGDTRNGAATTCGFVDATGFNSANTDFDDFYIDDAAYQGDVTVVSLAPNGNGSSSGWVGSDGNSTDNYLLVDDPTTSNVTDYVGASASGTLDLYTMVDIPAGYSVIAIQEVIYAQKSDAGTPPTLLPVAKGQSGTTRTDTAVPALSTTPLAYIADLRTTDPDGNALTAARVNAMEVGVKIS